MKEIEKGHNEEAKILLRKLHSSQTGYLSRKRKDDSEDGNKNTKGAAKSHGESCSWEGVRPSSNRETSNMNLGGCQTCTRTVIALSLHFPSF